MPKRLRLKLFLLITPLMCLVIGGTVFIPKWTTAQAASASSSNASWSMAGNNPQHTAFNSQEHVLSPSNISQLQPAWNYTTTRYGSYLYPSLVMADGVVFASFNDDKLYALDTRTGIRKWTYYTGTPINGSPAVANGIVYVSSSANNEYQQFYGSVVSALNTQTGRRKWSFSETNDVYTSPTVTNNTVYIGSYSLTRYTGSVYALNAQTGAIKWRYATQGGISSTLTVANGVVYVSGAIDGHIYALNALTGAVEWLYSTGGNINSYPIVANGMVYVGADQLYALNARTGKVKWSSPSSSSVPLAVANGIIYVQAVSTNTFIFNALNAQNGTLRWSKTGYYFAATIANGIVYGTLPDQLIALSTQTGELIWSDSSTQGFSSVVVVNGMVYGGKATYNSQNGMGGSILYAFHLPSTAH